MPSIPLLQRIDPFSECTPFQFFVIVLLCLIYDFTRFHASVDLLYGAFLCFLFREGAYILPREFTSVALL